MSAQGPPMPAIVCELCQQTFTRSVDAKRHYNSQHNLLLDAACPVCHDVRISGARIDRQVAHMRNRHPEFLARQQWIPIWILPCITGAALADNHPQGVTPQLGQGGSVQSGSINPGYHPAPATLGVPPLYSVYSNSHPNTFASAAPTDTGYSTLTRRTVTISNSSDITDRSMADGNTVDGNATDGKTAKET